MPDTIDVRNAHGAVVTVNTNDLLAALLGDLTGAPPAASLLGRLLQLHLDLLAAIPAGGNLIGKVGFDQTTPGVTNGVSSAGRAAAGAAPSGNPLLAAGSDGALVRTLLTDAAGNQLIAGDRAAGGADAGNPVKVGGFSSTTVPGAAASGNRVNAYFDPQGRLVVALGAGTQNASISSGAGDGLSSGTIGVFTHSQTFLFNGVNMDRMRGNNEVTALASAARTAAVNSADLVLYNGRRVLVTIDVTAYTAGASLTVSIKYKDTLSGQYVLLLASASIVAVGTYTLSVGPGLPAVANVSANAVVPRVYRIEVAVVNASSVTYSVSANHT